jgi:hypothetical protein
MWVCHLVSFAMINEYTIYYSKVFSNQYKKNNGRLMSGSVDFTKKLNSWTSLFKTSLRSYNIEYALRLYLT